MDFDKYVGINAKNTGDIGGSYDSGAITLGAHSTGGNPDGGACTQGPADSYHHLYNTARWLALRRDHLRAHPTCAYCDHMGRVVPATVCDHVAPHKGNVTLFYDATNLQSLCKQCHDGAKQQLERTGALRGCNTDGIPVDAAHHWAQG